MQKTAIDIGEPGPDKEFGWGLINADHPIIWNRSIEEAVTIGNREGFDLFYDVTNNKKEIGFTYNNSGSTLALTTGSALRPFGLRSKFLQQQNTFFQFGLQRALVDNVSFVSIFGRSSHEDVTVNKGSVGIQYQGNFSERVNLSVYAGYRGIWGRLGLPGYKAEVSGGFLKSA